MDFIRLTDPPARNLRPPLPCTKSAFPSTSSAPARPRQPVCPTRSTVICLLYEGDQFQGILLYWEGPGFRYVEHFAIAPELRGGGVGARALAELCGQGIPVILEIDPPVDEISVRRQHFYERCGFSKNPFPHVHPPYRKGFQGHPLVVMVRPGGPDPRRPMTASRGTCKITVMSDCVPPLEE